MFSDLMKGSVPQQVATTDQQGGMPQFNSFQDFLKSPQALALGMGLLQSSGYSERPVSFGEALGKGLLNMQSVGKKDLDAQYKQSLIENSQSEIEMRKAEIARKAQENQNKLQLQQKLSDLITGGGNPADVNNMARTENYLGAGDYGPKPEMYGPPLPEQVQIQQPPQPQQPSQKAGLMNNLDPEQKQIAAAMLASGDTKGALELINNSRIDPNKIFDQESKLRGDYTNASKDFKTIYDAYGRIKASASDPSPAGDVSLIYGYMKLLDPGSTVREGEYATAQNAASIPEAIRAKWNAAINGEKLTEVQRQDFVSRADKLYQSQDKRQKGIEKYYREVSKRSKLNPDNVVIDYRVDDSEQPSPQIAPGSSNTPTNTPAGGKVLRYNPKTRRVE